jgi:hypothetical protein
MSSLPLELLPLILDKLQWRTRDLAACCLVSKAWQDFATPRLYARLFLRDQQRLIRVFDSLKHNPALSALLRVLEIRVFPFGLQAEALERLEASILATLQAAVNLTELYWTRTGSLTDRVVPFLPRLPRLHTLELTGSSRFYSPAKIARHLLHVDKTPNLRHFAIVLPDRDVVANLAAWAQVLGEKLESFSVLCQHSALVTDEVLTAMSVHLTGLRRLSIAGCKIVTAKGVCDMLKASRHGVRDLAIEGLSVHPSSFVQMANHLGQLRMLSLTFPRQTLCTASEFWQCLATFVEQLPALQEFTHYTSSWMTPRDTYTNTLDSDDNDNDNDVEEMDAVANALTRVRFNGSTTQEYRRHELEEHASNGRPIVREPRLSSAFLRRLLAARGQNLTKVRIHGIVLTMEQVAWITDTCARLSDLVVHLYDGDAETLAKCLANLHNLRSLHILSSLYSNVYLSEDNLRAIAAACSTTLEQIGFRNRVWLVDRQSLASDQVSHTLPDGRRLILRRWDMSAGTFPEVLLVVRACEYSFPLQDAQLTLFLLHAEPVPFAARDRYGRRTVRSFDVRCLISNVL